MKKVFKDDIEKKVEDCIVDVYLKDGYSLNKPKKETPNENETKDVEEDKKDKKGK